MAKDKLKGTRVTSAGEKPTPMPGPPVSKSGVTKMSGNRVSKGPALPRKNDPSGSKYGGMGLKIGARVTSSRAKTK